MKILKKEYVEEAMQGCLNDDYKLICRAGRVIQGLAEGGYEIDVEDNIKRCYKASLYRKFMRAYTRYIMNNPNCVQELSRDICISSMENGEYTGIKD